MLKQTGLRDSTTRLHLYVIGLLTFYILYFLSLVHVTRI